MVETKEEKTEEKKPEETKEKVVETKEKKKGEEKKKVEEKPKKTEAIAKGNDSRISTKHAIAICNFIRGKDIDKAADELSQVLNMKRAIPMKGEIPHRKGKGMERGRYPINACKVFIKLLRSLSANSIVNGLEDPYIFTAKADKASRPYRRFGSRRFKRTNVLLIAKEKKKSKKAEKKKQEEKK